MMLKMYHFVSKIQKILSISAAIPIGIPFKIYNLDIDIPMT